MEKYKLTESGKKAVQAFIENLKAQQKKTLKEGTDTAKTVKIPDEEDILSDIRLGKTLTDWGTGAGYEYFAHWPCTDNKKSKDPLELFYIDDFYDVERKPLEDEILEWLWTLPFANPDTLTWGAEDIGSIWLDEAEGEVADTGYRVYGRNTGLMYKIFKSPDALFII